MKLKYIFAVLFVLILAALPMAAATGADTVTNNADNQGNDIVVNSDNGQADTEVEAKAEVANDEVKVAEKTTLQARERIRTAQYFRNNQGAQVRVMQLNKQVMQNHAAGEFVLAYVQENYPDMDTTELESIRADIETLGEEANAISLEELTKEEALAQFEAIREEAKELSTQFREGVHTIVPEEELDALRKQVKEKAQERVKEKQAEIEAKVKEQNRERMSEVLEELGVNIEEVKTKLQAGEMTAQEAKLKLNKHISAMNQEKKEGLKNMAQEFRARTGVAHQKMMNNINKEDVDALRAQLRDRVEAFQENHPLPDMGAN